MNDNTTLNTSEKLELLLHLHQIFHSENNDDSLRMFLLNELTEIARASGKLYVNSGKLFIDETLTSMLGAITKNFSDEQYSEHIGRRVDIHHTSNDVFTKNLNASQFILAGEIHEAVRLLRILTFSELFEKYMSIMSLVDDKKLAKRMSSEQKTCLNFKLDIILDILLEDCEKLKFIITD
jgi:hypothetical protein